jgi:hypothetical protein
LPVRFPAPTFDLKNNDTMNKFLFTSLFLIGFLVAGFGQSGFWTELKSPPGGAPTFIQQASNGWIFASFAQGSYSNTYKGPVFISKDNGDNWTEIKNPDAAKFPSLRIGRAGKIFVEDPMTNETKVSNDGGISFQDFPNPQNLIYFTEYIDGRIFAIKKNGFFNDSLVVSDSAGNSWEKLLNLPFADDILIDDFGKIFIYDFSNHNLFFSSDSGLNFQFASQLNSLHDFIEKTPIVIGDSIRLDHSPSIGYFRQNFIKNTQETIVIDSSSSWLGTISKFKIFNDTNIYCYSGNSLFYSTDYAKTWTILNLTQNQETYLMGGVVPI